MAQGRVDCGVGTGRNGNETCNGSRADETCRRSNGGCYRSRGWNCNGDDGRNNSYNFKRDGWFCRCAGEE